MTAWTEHRIPIMVPPLRGEALDSWIAWYSARLRVSTRDFLTMLRLPGSRPAQMVTGLTAQEERALTMATGLDGAELAAMTLKPFDGLAVTISHGQQRRLRRPPCWRRTGARSRFCPRCLEHTAGRWPLEWRLPWIYACHHHHCLLLEVCPACGNPPLAHSPSYRGPATPGLCSHPVPVTEPGERSWSRCRQRLAETPAAATAELSPSGPVMAAQHHLRELLHTGLDAPEQVGIELREIYALAWRALKGLGTVLDQAPAAVHDVLRDCGGTPRRFTDRKLPERPDQIAVGTAIAAIAHDPGHRNSPEVFEWILRADRAQFTRNGHQQSHRIERWQPAGERLTARVITSLNTTMNFHQRLRFGGAMPRPRWSALSADQARRRAAMIPALLWPSWSMRLLGMDATNVTFPDVFRAACSTCLLIPGTRLDFAGAGRLLGHDAPRRDRRIIDRLFQPASLTALASALAQLAHALDTHGSPIDYTRRRRLLTRETLRIDHRAYQRLCWEHGTQPGASGRERHMRTYLLHLLGAAPADHVVDVATNFVSEYRKFTATLPARLRNFLLDQARANLAEHRIDEPVRWEPPRHWVTDVAWPGIEPDDIDRSTFRSVISTCTTTTQAATALGMTPEHVRLFTDVSGMTAPEQSAAERARGRLVPLRGDLTPTRLRNLYEDQGLSYQEMAKATGCSNTAVVSALTHAGLRGRQRDRPGTVTRSWLEEQCIARGRSLRGIARECGVTAGELRKLAEQWGIPVWTGLTRPLPPEISSLPQPLAPDLHRVLTSKISLDTLRVLPRLPGQPSLSTAERHLGIGDIRHPLLRIERMLGFTIIERTRPLTATDRGQMFLARTGHLIRNLHEQEPKQRRSMQLYSTRVRPCTRRCHLRGVGDGLA